MRGYRILKSTGQLALIARVKEILTEHEFKSCENYFSTILMGKDTKSCEVVLRQFLLSRLAGISLNSAILISVGCNCKVVYPLPREWRVILESNGIDVDQFRSGLLWYVYIFVHLLYGIITIIRVLFRSIFSREKICNYSKKYVYFSDLMQSNLPLNSKKHPSFDIISWYLQWQGKESDIDCIHHNVSSIPAYSVSNIIIRPQVGPLPNLIGLRSFFWFTCWGLTSSLISIVDCFRGRWWHALLLSQASISAQARFLPTKYLAQEYLFHNSGWIYRPLWTYEIERRGLKVTFYFYSTNCESFKTVNGYGTLPYGWKAMSWPRYLVWDEYQADFVSRAVGNFSNIFIVGNIWFQDSMTQPQKVETPPIAVFDITPHRYSNYCQLGLDREFYTPSVVNSFLKHVNDAAIQTGALMLWKRKRKIGRVAHPQYRKFVDELSNNNNIILVDPEISAIRVIQSSIAVISMPFTSTALIAKDMGVPTVYYDPTGCLQKDDRAAHGVPILSEIKVLEEWISTQIINKKHH